MREYTQCLSWAWPSESPQNTLANSDDDDDKGNVYLTGQAARLEGAYPFSRVCRRALSNGGRAILQVRGGAVVLQGGSRKPPPGLTLAEPHPICGIIQNLLLALIS